MHDDPAFLRAIRDRPDDDVPRLVYADFLDERGEHARAEFIRAGCERARLGPLQAGWQKLTNRELVLLAENQAQWEQEFAPASVVRFDRGFASAIEIEAAGFVSRHQAIVGHGPAPAIWLRNAWEVIDELAHLPPDLGIRELDLSDNALTNPDLDRLLKAPWINGVEALTLTRNRLSTEAAQLVSRAPNLANLRNLALSFNEIGCTGASALAQSPVLGELRSLTLVATNLRGIGLTALINNSALAALEFLDLRQNPIGGGGFRALLMGDLPRSWKKLSLARSDVTSAQQSRLRERFGDIVSFEY
jgi:uncharacterized protein (TIGR02996 family)